ncbi:MAG: YidC/Oxa1 family membrane protein insertase [Candidatus Azotimanducaceae bacterium]|jgi:YidC/Oxa1 family membrane protein insertase
MDFQRIFVLLGLAVTAYLLILAWNEDYHSGKIAVSDATYTEQIAPTNENGSSNFNEDLPSSQESTPSTQGDFVPSVDTASQSQTPSSTSSAPNNSRLVSIKSDVLHLTVDTLGGDIVKVSLPAFPTTIQTPDSPFTLIDPGNSYAAQSGLIGTNGTDTSAGRPRFEVSSYDHNLRDGEPEIRVDLKLNQSGVMITKRFTVRRSDYLVDVDYIVENNTADSWQGALFAQIKRDREAPVISDENAMGLQPYTGAATFVPGTPYNKLEFDDIEEESYKQKVDGGYIAMVQHYFVSAWIPKGDELNTYQARYLRQQDVFLFGFTGPVWLVNSGEASTKGAQFYVGPKDQYRLEEISPGLNLTVDYGFLWWLAQPLFFLLNAIHGLVGNWGIAIIGLTILVKTLLFPLSAAGFKSMAKMRKLQPEMAKLKERFGDDKQKFSQAMMELYKKEGANPLGGCFPILLQMPVFLALYWTLMESVELRQAPFILWINDLSIMDPYFVLPILMGGSMFLTQMMQPEPPDPMQAKVMKLMPIMFTFFFLWFPSGLVLYWLVNNLLSAAQQFYVNKRIEAQP